MNNFKADLEYSTDIRKNEDFNKFYYATFQVKLIELVEYQKSKEEQFKGIDKKLHLQNGKVITVEEKCRRKDYGDILLELISNDRTNRKGWIYTCQSEYLTYFVEPSRKVYLFPVEILKLAWEHNKEDWEKKYRKVSADNKTYKSVCICIPAEVLKEAITKELQKGY